MINVMGEKHKRQMVNFVINNRFVIVYNALDVYWKYIVKGPVI